VEAPQPSDAEASAHQAGGHQPPGQASAFRRALDAQVEPPAPGAALVPAGPHDLTAPIDVSRLRATLARAAQGLQDAPTATATVAIPTVSAAAPSASGPTVVVPKVSAPTLYAPTTTIVNAPSTAPVIPAAASEGGPGGEYPDPEHAPRHAGSGGGRSRLPTAVVLSAALGAIAGTALVMLNLGHSGEPLAPTALPTKALASPHTTAPQPAVSHVATAPSHKAGASSSAPSGHASAATPPGAPAPAGPSTHPIAAVPADGVGASFATIYWTTDSEPLVLDIQQRLDRLGYLRPAQGASQYTITQRTFDDVQWHPNPDGAGYYQNSTDSAVRAFEFDYLQHRRGQLPGGGCSSQTYQALVRATS
jgi:hypothetical protein